VAIFIDELNRMSADSFVAALGDVAEHSPWVAERAAAARPFSDRAAVIDAFAGALRGATRDERLAVLRAHPDLAGRVAVAGELTGDSKREQADAGLDRLSLEEFERFTALNTTYKERFDMPFIFAVKGASKDMILAAFEERVGNNRESEFANALDNVCRILRFRLEDRVAG
jgi:2-oxo-4-hydroxy-4-carboxy-5-ureidoimidazoline decarboxylase